jgi:hypothetical protein
MSSAIDGLPPEQRAPDVRRRRGRILTPPRILAVVALALLLVRLRRQIRFARNVLRHRRRLRLALALLIFVRQLRKS